MSTEFLEGSSGHCSRCGKPIANGWASSWPIHCDIIIGRAATLCYPVTGNLLDPRQVQAHPACTKYGAQETRFHWSNADYKGPVAWPICFKCHDEFLTLLGHFLKLRKYTPEQEREEREAKFIEDMERDLYNSESPGS